MMTSQRTFIEEPAEGFAAARARLVSVTVARLERAPRLDLLDLALEDTATETARHCDRNNTTLRQKQHDTATETTRHCDRNCTTVWQKQHDSVTETARQCDRSNTTL